MGLTDPEGDTAGVLRGAGLNAMARLDSVNEILAVLPDFVSQWRRNNAALPLQAAVQTASRRVRTISLSVLLNGVDGTVDIAANQN